DARVGHGQCRAHGHRGQSPTAGLAPAQSAGGARAAASGRHRVKAFAYVNASSDKDAVAALKFDGIALPLAGGQDLLARMNAYIDTPERVVNVKNALDRTAAPTSGGGWRIGASMKIVDLLEHADIGKMYPAIIAAATDIGTPQIRHQGTVGGNLNQRPRCGYFRNEEFACYKN